ncbi:hypothetical protein JYT99_03190 [bacterium AH-315-E09]|nr:hypothetical protein [bacterium AH-315-E09]
MVNSNLKKENLRLQKHVKMLKNLAIIYDEDFKLLHNVLKAPFFYHKEGKNLELLQEVYNYIINNNIYDDSLVFQVGSVAFSYTEEGEVVYVIDLYYYEVDDLHSIMQDLDNFFVPVNAISFSQIHIVKNSEGVKHINIVP